MSGSKRTEKTKKETAPLQRSRFKNPRPFQKQGIHYEYYNGLVFARVGSVSESQFSRILREFANDL